MDSSSLPRRDFLRGSAAGLLGAALLDRFDSLRSTFLQQVDSLQDVALTGLADQYSLDPKITYLNHASIGTIPKPVQKARQGYLQLCESNPWLYMWGGAWDEAREEARRRVATVLGCSAKDVVFNHNTTEGFNLLASGLPLGKGDEVLFSSLNHVGASECWRHQAQRRGFKVREFAFPVTEAAALTRQRVLDLHAAQIRPETKVLVIPHIDNMIGLRHPLRALVDLAHSEGVRYVAVDGAQSVGMIPLDLADSGVDFYCSSPHKWLQVAKGLGLMYVRRESRGALQPMQVTWGQKRWQGTVRVFEDYGTRNLAEVLSFRDAVDFHDMIGAERKQQRLQELWRHVQAGVERIPGLHWRSPRDWQLSSSLYAIEVEGHSSAEIADKMWSSHRYVFRAFSTQGLNTIRISPNFFTKEVEIDRFLDLLRQEFLG